jgi:hypothetical protein
LRSSAARATTRSAARQRGRATVISGNVGEGVRIDNAGTTGNVILGNLIGLDASGVAAVSNAIGVRVIDAVGNTIGGTATGSGNVIAGNTQQGVLVTGAAPEVAILGNSIHDNGALGIDLGTTGVTANDPGDGDSAPTPAELSRARQRDHRQRQRHRGRLAQQHRFDHLPNRILFGDGAGSHGIRRRGNPARHDQCRDRRQRQRDDQRLLSGVALAAGQRVTATATRLTGGTTPATTSEFSLGVSATAAPVSITSDGGGPAASINVAENSTAITTVTASGTSLVYSIIGGADSARFAINASTGALSFVAAPNFEAPGDANADNVYDVQVQVSDGSTTTRRRSASRDERQRGAVDHSRRDRRRGGEHHAVMTVTASDPDAGTTSPSRSSAAPTRRASRSTASTGALSFSPAPNYEAPGDANANNVYDVQVQVSDGTLTRRRRSR